MKLRPQTTLALSSFMALVALALAATPAMATKIHVFSNSFTLPASASPIDVAINQSTEEVYTASYDSSVVYAFDASGSPDPTHPQFTETDGTTPFPFGRPYGLAVDNSAGPNNGDVYVADAGVGAVVQFGSSGVRTSQAPITAVDVPVGGTAQPGGLPAVFNNGGFTPTGVAIASDGDVYAADASNNVIDVFKPSGTFVSQLGANHVSGPNAIALDGSGNLYVAQNGSGLIEFGPSGTCVDSCSSIDPSANLGVTTDPEGNVYADEGANISEFNFSAEPLYSFGGGTLAFGRGLAFSESSGAIYVADEGASNVDIYKSIPVATVTIQPFTSSGPPTGTITGDVDPAGSGNVIACHFEYGSEKGNYSLGSTPCIGPSPADSEIGTATKPIESATEVHASLTGLVTLKTYHYRLVATDANGTIESSDHNFSLLPNLPRVSETSSSDETPTTATLKAAINPGLGNTVYRFQYGTSKSYESSTIISPAGSDNSDHVEIAELSGLTPSTTYHFRAVAINYTGTTDGPDQIFTTPSLPTVGGADASNITSSTATLEAQIDPKLAATTYHFQYGTGTSYGLNTPESSSIGADNTIHNVGADIAGLAPSTTYHFRAIATNRFGATKGFDQTFTTAAAQPVISLPAKQCRNGYVKRQGRCVKKFHRKSDHHRRAGTQ